MLWESASTPKKSEIPSRFFEDFQDPPEPSQLADSHLQQPQPIPSTQNDYLFEDRFHDDTDQSPSGLSQVEQSPHPNEQELAFIHDQTWNEDLESMRDHQRAVWHQMIPAQYIKHRFPVRDSPRQGLSAILKNASTPQELHELWINVDNATKAESWSFLMREFLRIDPKFALEFLTASFASPPPPTTLISDAIYIISRYAARDEWSDQLFRKIIWVVSNTIAHHSAEPRRSTLKIILDYATTKLAECDLANPLVDLFERKKMLATQDYLFTFARHFTKHVSPERAIRLLELGASNGLISHDQMLYISVKILRNPQ